MLQTVKYNLLIPFQYDPKDVYKLSEDRIAISKTDVDACKCKETFDSKLWFQYCFKEKPIENNYQMDGSPLLENDTYRMTRIELDSVVRKMIGIQQKENAVYSMDKSNISFSIGKIRLLFTKNKIGFIHIEVSASNLDENAVRKFGYAFKNVNSNQPKMSYQRRLSRDTSEDVTISFKQLINNIVELQTYLSISIYKNRITPYVQISIIGACEAENKYTFFNSIQALSRLTSTESIEEAQIYRGQQAYISRFVGDRTACIYGDTEICGEENVDFLTNVGNGLIKTATENYTTVYAFLISIRLLALENPREYAALKYLTEVPMYLSQEDNIRKFFQRCLWDAEWALEKKMEIFRARIVVIEAIKAIYREIQSDFRDTKEKLESSWKQYS